MDKTEDNPGLSAEDLKGQLYQSLHSSGLLKKLKGQLRQSMISELRGKNDSKLSKNKNQANLLASTIHKKSHSWLLQAIDNLVYLHLKQNRYQYSLSLFQQESSVENYTPSLTTDLLERLGLRSSDLDVTVDTPSSSISDDVSHLTSTPTNQRHVENLTLWTIMNKLSSLAATGPSSVTMDRGKLTFDDGKTMSLGEKLRAIDEEMQPTLARAPRDPAIAVSSYTAAVRRAEEDADRRARASFKQWKSTDLLKMKIEEAKSSKALIDKRLKELEDDYQSKRDALQERERSAVARLNNQRTALEKEMHDQRQHLLSELGRLQTREDGIAKKEQVVHETDLLKANELKTLFDRSEEPTVKEPTDSSEIRVLRDELAEKSMEMQQMKRELSQLKTELSCAKVDQIERENMLLRTQLGQLLSGKDECGSLKRTCKPDECLRDEIKKLKDEKVEQETRHRSLALTIKEMQQALEDSNAALALISTQQPRVRFASPQPATSEVQRIASTFPNSSPSGRNRLREYEPVETSLHPSITKSDEFDDPSMDSAVAAANVRLDLQQRLIDLETQTSEVDNHYQRYLNTHYKELMEAQSKARIEQAKEQARPFLSTCAARSPVKSHISSPSRRLQHGGTLDLFGLKDDPVTAVRKTSLRPPTYHSVTSPSERSPIPNRRYEAPVKDDSLFDSAQGHDLPGSKVTETLARKTEVAEQLLGSPNISRDVSRASSTRTSSRSVAGVEKEAATTPPTSPAHRPASSGSSGVRKMSSSSVGFSSSDAESTKGDLSFNASTAANKKRDESFGAQLSNRSKGKLDATTEEALPSRSRNIPVGRDGTGTSGNGSEESRTTSVGADASLSLLSSSTGRAQRKPGGLVGKEEPVPLPRKSDDDHLKSLSGFTTDENLSEKAPKKSLNDFDLTNDEDISAALRWGDENKPTLDSDRDDIFSASDLIKDRTPPKDPAPVQEKEAVDVFEMSSEQNVSLDSLESSGKARINRIPSDTSW